MMNPTRLAIGLLGTGLVACASVPPPHQREASSEAAIRGAKEVGAEQVPQAALHLKLAQEELDKAQNLMRDGDNEEAGYVLLRSQTDAELALAMARENKTRAEAQQAFDKAQALRRAAPTANPWGGGPR
jgi:Domain of unknown function (DUF4398)